MRWHQHQTLSRWQTWQGTLGEFSVEDQEGQSFNVKWRWSPTQPSTRPGGITGWADRNGDVVLIHVCANSPCTAVYPASKYGHMPVPTHVRFRGPAVAGPSAATSPDALRTQHVSRAPATVSPPHVGASAPHSASPPGAVPTCVIVPTAVVVPAFHLAALTAPDPSIGPPPVPPA